MNDPLLSAMLAHGRVDGDRLPDEAFHLRVASGGPDLEVASASGAAFGQTPSQERAVIAACDASSHEDSAIESLNFSNHPDPDYQCRGEFKREDS